MPDIFDLVDTDVKGGDIFDQMDTPKESFGKSALRTAYQPVSGFLNTTAPGVAANVWHMLAQGEVLDDEEIERIKDISEREGVPFDEEQYREAAQEALQSIPTVGNIERAVEEKTGAPLEAKTRLQKGLKTFTEASRLAPKGASLRPSKVPLTKPMLGAGVEITKEALIEAGVPESLAEPISYAILGKSKGGEPQGLSVERKTKPSGLAERGFEKLTKPHEIPEKKLTQINQKLESDFRKISDKIIAESPVGETFNELKNNPAFKKETQELLSQAQEIADTIPDKFPTMLIKTELADLTKSPKKAGYLASDYDKAYSKYVKEMIKEIPKGEIGAGDLVHQFRENNQALKEYYEPGSSKAINRAKRDAILDHNRSIVKMMEKSLPDSKLVPVFKEGNQRWSRIMDAEVIDEFIGDIFSKKKIDFKQIDKYFEKEGYSRIFKRSLGQEGYKNFETLMKDMLTSETPYKMLKTAQSKGFGDLVESAAPYIIHPKLGAAHSVMKIGRESFKYAINALLDKPQLMVTWKKGVDNIKKGKFAEATKDFEALKKGSEETRVKTLEKFNQKLESKK